MGANNKKARSLKIRWWIFFCSPLIISLLLVVYNLSNLIFSQFGKQVNENTSVDWILWIITIISFILFIIGCFFIGIAGKYEKYNKNPSFLKDGEVLTEEQEKSIRKFSWWWFLSPYLMLFFSKNYIWAILILFFDAFGLLPRTIVGRYWRRRLAENRNWKDFEEYEKKTRIRWIICSCIWIFIIILFCIYLYYSINSYIEENPRVLYMFE